MFHLPAAVLLVNADKELSEGAASARLGICLLAGFAVGLLADVASAVIASKISTKVSQAPDEEIPAVGEASQADANAQLRTSISIFVGDFFHNMGDGFFIAAAFKVCGTHMGWTVRTFPLSCVYISQVCDLWMQLNGAYFSLPSIAIHSDTCVCQVAWGAFAHELAQELADFFVLVGPAGLPWWKAILINVRTRSSFNPGDTY